MVNTLFQERVINRHKRSLSKTFCERDQEYTQEYKSSTNFNEPYAGIRTHCSRHHHQVEVKPVTNKYSYGNDLQHDHLTFRISCHENKEWEYKVYEQVYKEYPFVMIAKTLNKVDRFFRNICIPDQHEL